MSAYQIIDPSASIAPLHPIILRIASGTALVSPSFLHWSISSSSSISSSDSGVGYSSFSSCKVFSYEKPSQSRKLVQRQLSGRIAFKRRVVETERFPYE